MPDHTDWEEVVDRDPEAIQHLQSSMVERMSVHQCVRGRMTFVEAHGTVYICLEGWETQPEDMGPEPTSADVPVGFG